MLIMILLFANDLISQNPKNIQDKYWNYRARFLGSDGGEGFISVGPARGQSLPMAGRNPEADCLRDWHLVHHKCQTTKGKGKAGWGDGTIYLAYYIATLALEYRNLKDAGQDVTSCSKELYFAMKAFDRLDARAEEVLGFAPKLDGFYMRDDVPGDFFIKGKKEKRFVSKKGRAYHCVESAGGCGKKTLNDGSFASQDQTISLIFAFAFVKKLLSDEYPKNSTQSFGDLAALYTHRMVNFLLENKWRIKGPGGGKVSNRWGGDCRAFSSLMAEAAEKITEKKYRKSYQGAGSRFLGKTLAGTYNWAYFVQNKRNHVMIYNMIIAAGRWNGKKITRRCKRTDQIVFSLANAVLNNEPIPNNMKEEEVVAILESAPWDGPCFNTPGCKAPDGWKSTDRWWHEGWKNGNPHGLVAEYSGLDYMFFYNLYHYLYKRKLPRFRSLLDTGK